MTPAEKPRDAASTRRFASFTRDGKNTTAAPIPVEAPAPRTKSKAGTRFSFGYDMLDSLCVSSVCDVKVLRNRSSSNSPIDLMDDRKVDRGEVFVHST